MQHERRIVIGASSGSSAINDIGTALRNIYRNESPSEASNYNKNTATSRLDTQKNSRKNRRPQEQSARDDRANTSNNRPSWYTYSPSCQPNDYPTEGKSNDPKLYSFHSPRSSTNRLSAVIDPGAVASQVGQDTLHDAIRSMGIQQLHDGEIQVKQHFFGDYNETRKTI